MNINFLKLSDNFYRHALEYMVLPATTLRRVPSQSTRCPSIVHKYGGTSMGLDRRASATWPSASPNGRARGSPDGGGALGDERRDQPPARPGQGAVAGQLVAVADARTRHDRRDRRAGLRRPAGDRAAGRGHATPSAIPAGRCGVRPTTSLHQGPHPEHRRRPRHAPTSTPAAWSSSPASRAWTEDGNITTLGRGGSDTSAVAMAAAHQGRRMPDLHRRGRRLHDRSARRARKRAA